MVMRVAPVISRSAAIGGAVRRLLLADPLVPEDGDEPAA